ncbi:BspA family leucine-rich repeat surface protein [Mycoplasmopsis bovis]|nr:BspA family leucine-rich repeat surface protein [Mycoplasmopsis bovis]QQH35934.1 BspA family leucine-rich repeat surface protein [Mycoplasmopsis bovis]
MKISSLKFAFKDFKFEKVLNLDKWDVSNVRINEFKCFMMQKNLIKIFQNWNTKNVKNMLSLFAWCRKI